MKNTVHVETSGGVYDIHIASDLINSLGTHITAIKKPTKVFLIADQTTHDLYGDRVVSSCTAVNLPVTPIVIPVGESSKSYETLQDVLDQLLYHHVDRSSMIIALGGGVVGDLAGLAASVVMRGIDFIQIPTTLLAQVDSSVGGKTGINTSHGKNLIGSFWQPALVLMDTNTLNTLPKRHLMAGYAEILKYALINDPTFFEWLEANGERVLNLEQDALTYALTTSCQHKADIVSRDEREKGERALLNLGHTFGHAIEAIAGYDGTILHGEAVAMGMQLAFTMSHQIGLCPEQDVVLPS